MDFFYVVKATQKSGKQDAVIWFTAKSEARALLQLDVDLEDAGIETGRGKDYLKPHRTNFPVVDGLPEESTVDYTWCERYALDEDGLTWQLKAGAPVDEFHPAPGDSVVVDAVDATLPATLETTPPPATAETDAQRSAAAMQDRAINHTAIPFEKRVFGTWLFGLFDELTPEQYSEASRIGLDMDEHYAQNVALACRNVAQLKHVFPETLADLFAAAKSVWPVDGKAPPLNSVISFFSEWIDTHTTGKTSREDVTAKWQKKHGSSIVKTDAGTSAGGGNKTDRNQDYAHTLDTLDVEIALATLPMDFDIYEIPGSIHRRAKEIVSKKESPFKEWSAALRSTPGILDFSRAAIFALVRGAAENAHHFPVSLQTYINANLTEANHEKPTAETLTAARQVDSAAVVAAVIQGNEPVESLDKLDTTFATVGKLAAEAAMKPAAEAEEEITREMVDKQLAADRGEFVPGISDPSDPKWDKTPGAGDQPQPEIQRVSKTVFSIDGLMGSTTTTQETAAHEQMETTVQVEDETDSALSAGESADEAGQQATTLTPAEVLAAAAPSLAAASAPEDAPEPEEAAAPQYPEYFEPGRYEGLPNNVYHAANGISSTQVKDARVSLMFYHGRHVTKTIRRESSEALAFGSLAHTMALEPEKLEEEFAVFPGVPAEAFTNTDSLKAFIREYNADKPKAEQLKLTGKKEELQDAIRAVKPNAIFADEFERQWCDSVAGKTILSSEQLALATAIQQALLNHESAGKLLRHPSRAVETSYFGFDDETGLEVRVRPDLEVEINGVRIGVDLKTISMGRIKQDGLRARLHREIIDRDYHLSAGMYSSVADFDQFFWIFVNKDEGHHWVAVIEASRDLLDLGLLEYQKTMRALAAAYDTDCWPAPITADYTDELNDFDLRRLESLRAQA